MNSIPAELLQRAITVYVSLAYPAGASAALETRVAPIFALASTDTVPESLLEPETSTGTHGFALRLGQPLYPHMKLIIEPAPSCGGADELLLRVDTHDRHLHAPEGSPDAAWLASIRASNKQLTEHIEAAWSHAHLPTFKNYLRRQLEAKRARM